MIACKSIPQPSKNYQGEFRGEIPIGLHVQMDDADQAEISVDYNARGLIRKIELHDTGRVYKFPKKLDLIEWTEIKPGLWINTIEEGENFEQKFPKKTEITSHYAGYLLDGQIFDNSFVRATPLDAQLGHLIPGFSLGIWNVAVGTVRVIKVSPELAYKDRLIANIPPNSTLIYFIYRLQ